jgi:hypothetical protein
MQSFRDYLIISGSAVASLNLLKIVLRYPIIASVFTIISKRQRQLFWRRPLALTTLSCLGQQPYFDIRLGRWIHPERGEQGHTDSAVGFNVGDVVTVPTTNVIGCSMGAMQRYITYALIDHKRTSDLDSDFNDNNLFRNNGAYQKVTVSPASRRSTLNNLGVRLKLSASVCHWPRFLLRPRLGTSPPTDM